VRAVAPWHDRGSPAVIGTSSFRPVALRPRLSTGLPFSRVGERCQTFSHTPSVEASRSAVKYLNCVAALKEQLHIIPRCSWGEYVSMWRRFRGCWSWPIGLPGFAAPEATRAGEVLMVITGGEIAVRHYLAGTRRMNEATVSCIDSHVIDVATMDTEEDQIARRQRLF
jgi:hypothetical protein